MDKNIKIVTKTNMEIKKTTTKEDMMVDSTGSIMLQAVAPTLISASETAKKILAP